MNYIPKYIKRNINKRQAEKVTNTEWNELFNLLINQGDYNTKAIEILAKGISDCLTEDQVEDLISTRVLESGAADMTQAVYDTNSDGVVDKAESVVVGGVITETLADGSVTIEKLEDSLINKLNYSNNNIGSILVQLNSKDQISGTEGMVLFGLDGTLETGSNIVVNKIHNQINTEGYTQGTFTLQHNIQNATSILNTTDNYTLTNYHKYFKTKLSSITNAVFSKLTNLNTALPLVDLDTTKAFVSVIKSMGNGTYIVFLQGSAKNKHKVQIPCVSVYKITYNGTTVSKQHLYSSNYQNLLYGDVAKWGDYAFSVGDNYDVYGSHNFETIITVFNKSGAYSEVYLDEENYTLRAQAFSSNGNVLSIDRERTGDRTSYAELYKYNSTTKKHTTMHLAESTNGSINIRRQYSGRWVTMFVDNDNTGGRDYYLVDLYTGTLYTEPAYLNFAPDAYDEDGIHFYYNGAKYRIDDSTRELVKVATINNYNLKNSFGIVNNNIYFVGKEVWCIENNMCTPVYSLLSTFNEELNIDANATIDSPKYSCALENINKGIYLVGSSGITAKPFTFAKGSITIPTANNESIPGPLTITRDQSCTIPAGQTKDIYLKVKTNNITFTLANLICYFNRALTTSDSITVTFNETVLAPLSKSTDTIKYYSHTYEATSNIEVLVRVKAGTTALQVTQILGGVDNGV